MPKQNRTLREQYGELQEKSEKLKREINQLSGEHKEKVRQRISCLEELKELGIKKPEDEGEFKKQLSVRKKKLYTLIDTSIKDIEIALEKIKEARSEGESV